MADAQAIIQKIRLSGGIPAPAYIAQRCGVSEVEAVEIIKKTDRGIFISGQGDGKTLPRARSSGRGKISNDKRVISPAPIMQIGAVQSARKTLREHAQAGLTALLPFVFFAAGIAGAIRSYTMCYSFFARINTGTDAMLFSGLLVAVAFATPQAVPILWPQVRQGKRIPMFLIAVVVSIASIGTNASISVLELAGQRLDSGSALAVDLERREQIESQITELSDRLADERSALEIDRAERVALLAAQAGLEVGSYDYNRTRNNLADTKRRIDQAQVKIDDTTAKIAGLRDTLASLPVAVSGAVAHGEAENYINIMTAFILEIGAPLALSLALHL